MLLDDERKDCESQLQVTTSRISVLERYVAVIYIGFR
jgi:hypothetical protein